MADENVALPGSLGGIFAKASGVTNAAANIIAEFEGGWTIALEEEFAEFFGQSTIRQGATMVKLDVALSIPEVLFKPASLTKLWNITPGAIAIKSVAAEAATSYTIGSSTLPRELEYLVSVELDGQVFQAWAETGKINSSTLNFSNLLYGKHNIDLILYGASGNLLNLLDED